MQPEDFRFHTPCSKILTIFINKLTLKKKVELFKFSGRTKLFVFIALGYPFLALVSVIALSFCIDKVESAVCSRLIPNLQSIWTLWLFCTILLVIFLLLGRKSNHEHET